MAQPNDPRGTPKDARKVTERQRERQDKHDYQLHDPHAPGLHESRDQIADET